ncbi:MAG: hypothetical protein KKD74_07840 [Bacteroidetes bacterium]|nr:hypothetical protein [Bacteroidales bacterium]MBU1010029.1 hypothetical protein [Bacteroidota bacterium]
MNYELKIEHAIEENGTIDLQRLVTIATGIRNIAEGALQMRLRGVSLTKGRKKVSLSEALRVSLTGIKDGSTILQLNAEQFSKTLEPWQTDIFRQEAQQNLPDHTPVSLFIEAFRDATLENGNQDLLDKSLLKELKQFKKAFQSDNEVFVISNEGTIPALELKKPDFKKIQELDEEIPDSEPILINGIVEELKYSKLKVKIKTSEGIVDGFLSDDLTSDDIAQYWGKEVTIGGTAHFKGGGRSVIEISRIFEASEGDQYFSRKPKAETVEQQINRQLKEKGFKNTLADIVGKWPGEETDEEFEELLKNL